MLVKRVVMFRASSGVDLYAGQMQRSSIVKRREAESEITCNLHQCCRPRERLISAHGWRTAVEFVHAVYAVSDAITAGRGRHTGAVRAGDVLWLTARPICRPSSASQHTYNGNRGK